MAKLGQIKSGTMRVGNTTSTGYGIVYADEIIGHRRVANYSDLNNIPDWCLYNAAGGDTPSTAVGQLWYVSNSDEASTPETMHSAGLYQLVSYDGKTKTWKQFKNAADIVDTDTTYTFTNGTNGSFTVTPKGGSAQTVTIGKPATAGTADKATKATNDKNGHDIAETYLTKFTASSTYATKSDVASLTSALVYKGTVDATHALPTTSVKVGDVYVVAAAGTYAGQVCENGDMIIASSTTPTWTVVQANINGAVTATNTLADNAIVLGSNNRSVKTFATTSTAGYLYWTGTAYAWKTPAEFSLKAASADSLGGIKIGYTATGKNYPVQLDANSKAYVNVPWTDTDTKYTLPVASDTTLGGIKTGYESRSPLEAPIYTDNGKAYAEIQMSIVNEIITEGEGVSIDSNGEDYELGATISLKAASSNKLGGVKAAPTATTTFSAMGDLVSNNYYQVNEVSIDPTGTLLYLQATIEPISDETIKNTFN